MYWICRDGSHCRAISPTASASAPAISMSRRTIFVQGGLVARCEQRQHSFRTRLRGKTSREVRGVSRETGSYSRARIASSSRVASSSGRRSMMSRIRRRRRTPFHSRQAFTARAAQETQEESSTWSSAWWPGPRREFFAPGPRAPEIHAAVFGRPFRRTALIFWRTVSHAHARQPPVISAGRQSGGPASSASLAACRATDD